MWTKPHYSESMEMGKKGNFSVAKHGRLHWVINVIISKVSHVDTKYLGMIWWGYSTSVIFFPQTHSRILVLRKIWNKAKLRDMLQNASQYSSEVSRSWKERLRNTAEEMKEILWLNAVWYPRYHTDLETQKGH